MSSMASIVVNDGESTPVAHTFDPVRITNGDLAEWVNRAQAYQAGRENLKLSLREIAKGTVRKATVNTMIPRVVTETINGAAVSSSPDFGGAKTEFTIPLSWTKQQAKNLRVEHANALAHAIMAAAVDDGEFVW